DQDLEPHQAASAPPVAAPSQGTPAGAGSDRRRPAPGSARDELALVGIDRALVLGLGGFQQVTPRAHIRTPPQQSTPLPLGHATPDTELDPVVQSVRQALGPYRASTADELGSVLRRPLHEQGIRIRVTAGGAGGPIRDPHL